jgi:hypothetical protein
MTDTDYRAELQLLFDAAESFTEPALGHHRAWQAAMNRARALLDQPEPVAPTDEELLASVRHLYGDQTAADMGAEDDLRTARAVLARYSRPTIQPVAPESGYEKGYAQEHLARLMRDAIGTETNHNVYIVAAGKILDRPEFMHVARYYRPTIERVS